MQISTTIVGMIGPALVLTLAVLVIGRRERGESLLRQQLRTVIFCFAAYALCVAVWLLIRAAGPGVEQLDKHIWTLVGIAITLGAVASAIAHIIVPVERDDAGSTENIGLPPWRLRGSTGDVFAPRPRWFRPMRAVACIAALGIAPSDDLAPIMVMVVLLASDWIANKWLAARAWTAMAASAPRTVASAQSEISRIIAQAQRTRAGTGPTPRVPPTTT